MTDEETVTITLSILNVVLIISSVLYIWCLVLASRKMSSLYRVNPDLGLKKLLVVSIILICIVRIMTFVGVTAMDIANVRAHYSPNPSYGGETEAEAYTGSAGSDIDTSSDGTYEYSNTSTSDNQNFYDSSMTILFDLPNAIVVSTYVLLTLVWAECFLQSRFHTESVIKWKKRWLTGYTVFNSCLFFGQIILYILIFCPGTDDSVKIVKGIIYTGMIATNLGVCGIATFSYFYLNFRFAGFPFKSLNAKNSLTKISKVFFFWSLSRFIWAIANIIVFTYGIELLHDSKDPILSALLLFFLLLLCEILPMMIMLDYSYIQIISFERSAHDNDRNSNNNSHDLNNVIEEQQAAQQYNGDMSIEEQEMDVNWLDLNESLLSSVIKEERNELSEPLIEYV